MIQKSLDETSPYPVSRSAVGDFFSRLVAWSLSITYFLVTASFYLKTYDSAQIKLTMTQVGCGSVIFFWILQLLFQKRWPFKRSDLPLVAPFLAVFVSGVVSFAQSSFQQGSLDEFTRRVFYIGMALIVITEFRGHDRQKRLLRWLIAAFAVTVFYGFIQYFDNRLFPPGVKDIFLDPFVWRQAFNKRVFSSFGNPNFFGNFLVIITPIIISLYLRNNGKTFQPFILLACLVPTVVLTDKILLGTWGGVDATNQGGLIVVLIGLLGVTGTLVWWKSSSALSSGLLIFFVATFVNLYATETKGAWLGFIGAVSASAVLIGSFLLGSKARKKTLLLLGAVAIAAGGGVLTVKQHALKQKQSVDFRVFTWIGTWDMIRQQPWLGTGIGSFKWAYPAYRRPEIILLEGRSNTETDHVEDEYLEVLFDEGILGFGLFLWLIVSVSFLGLKALTHLTKDGPRPPPGPMFPEQVYLLIAFLGAWWGALVHWFMDVSIRFVSSGVYSFLLPALVVGLIRNEREEQDVPHPSDAWIRLLVIGLWMAFFVWATVEASLVLLVGGLLIVLGEGLEHGLSSKPKPGSVLPWVVAGLLILGSQTIEMHDLFNGSLSLIELFRTVVFVGLFTVAWVFWKTGKQTVPPFVSFRGKDPINGRDIVLALILIGAWVGGLRVWRGYFLADISHNTAIFFSKQRIWTRSPENDETVKNPQFPLDMRTRYEKVGGALEHYQKTIRLNPAFPMANYFVGNAYNDWGSGLFDKAKEARDQGNVVLAEKLRTQAEENWQKALDTYTEVKKFAPNYVQTHHQVGLVYLKMGEMFNTWGQKEKAKENWEKAIVHFKLYQQLDPVFPGNYYRQAYTHYMLGETNEAEKNYQGALAYNSQNVVGRVYEDRNTETYSTWARMYYVQLMNEYPNRPIPADSDLFKKTETLYLKALEAAKRSGQEEEIGVEPAKSLAMLYGRVGLIQKSSELWYQIRAWNPQDPDVQKAFSRPPKE